MRYMIETREVNGKRFYFIDSMIGVQVVDKRGGYYGVYKTMECFIKRYKEEGENLFIEYRDVIVHSD